MLIRIKMQYGYGTKFIFEMYFLTFRRFVQNLPVFQANFQQIRNLLFVCRKHTIVLCILHIPAIFGMDY